MIWVLLHNVAEKAKEKLPELLGFAVTGTGFMMDVINFVNALLELIVKIGYVSVSVVTVIYLVKKAKTLKK